MPVTCAAAAQNLQIECGCILHAFETCLDVVKRDLSLKTRMRTSPNSSGVLSYGSELFLGRVCHRSGN